MKAEAGELLDASAALQHDPSCAAAYVARAAICASWGAPGRLAACAQADHVAAARLLMQMARDPAAAPDPWVMAAPPAYDRAGVGFDLEEEEGVMHRYVRFQVLDLARGAPAGSSQASHAHVALLEDVGGMLALSPESSIAGSAAPQLLVAKEAEAEAALRCGTGSRPCAARMAGA